MTSTNSRHCEDQFYRRIRYTSKLGVYSRGSNYVNTELTVMTPELYHIHAMADLSHMYAQHSTTHMYGIIGSHCMGHIYVH